MKFRATRNPERLEIRHSTRISIQLPHQKGIFRTKLRGITAVPLMSGIERKYCLISTSYLAALFDIFLLLHI